jgi:hypothetical protein
MAAVNAFTDNLRPSDALLLVVTSLLAWMLLAVGLIAPLTPSEGHPTALAISFFYLLPVGALAVAARWSLNRAVRAVLFVELVLVLVAGGYIIHPQFG